jgi:hypothetical protein
MYLIGSLGLVIGGYFSLETSIMAFSRRGVTVWSRYERTDKFESCFCPPSLSW